MKTGRDWSDAAKPRIDRACRQPLEARRRQRILNQSLQRDHNLADTLILDS